MRSGVNSNTVSVIDSTNSTAVVTAAAVSSKTQTASFGYYEARVKASKLSMTSSFWLQSHSGSPGIEIDVIELLGTPVLLNPGYNMTMASSTHYVLNKQDSWVSKFYTMPSACGEQFSVYGVWWKDARTIYYYFNGQKVNEIINPPPGNVDFSKDQYLFFTTEVFRWYGYPTVASHRNDSLNTMLVDYVRGWELVPATGGTSPSAPP